MQYIDCKAYAQEILDAVKNVERKKELIILSMGDDPASQSYIKGKIKDCEYCGIPYCHIKTNTYESVERYIKWGNENENVGGIIVQLPLPDRDQESRLTNMIAPEKDVDGFVYGSHFKPCTPEGVVYILEKEFEKMSDCLAGKTALVIGRGKLVGRPLVDMLLEKDVTVQIAHSKTPETELEKMIKDTDIIVSAVGKPNLLNLKQCDAYCIIDVGVNRNKEGKLCGDCFGFDEVDMPYMRVSPVPGGMGLLTRAMLMRHMVSGLEI